MPADPQLQPSMDRLLRDLVAYLEWQKEDGLTRLDVAQGATRAAPPPPPAPDRAPKSDVAAELVRIAAEVADCKRCPLHAGRTRTVPGQGNPAPELMFVGEGPGASEDEQGLAFVGKAGQLLTKMIEAMGLQREAVFISNIVKCRPPDNRVPEPEEMAACMPFLHRQIALLRPKVIVALGATALKGLIPGAGGITKVRGTWHVFDGIDLMPTYHPAYLLRNPPAKKDAWADLQEVLRKLGRPVPGKG